MTPDRAAQTVTEAAAELLALVEQIVGVVCGALAPLPPDREPFAMAALGYALARLSARAPEAIPAADALRELALAYLTMEPGDACQTGPGGAPPEILYRCRDGARHICAMYRAMECDGYYTPEAKDCAKPNLADLTRTQKAEYAAYRALGSVEQLAGLAGKQTKKEQ